MRKSRFLISLIAATAIGLAGVGCESSDSGAVRDTSDISNSGGNVDPNERRYMREYLLVAQRGLEVPAANFGTTGGSLPTVAGRESGVSPKDQVGVAAGLLFELTGITNVPSPNLSFTQPGVSTNRTPTDTSEVQEAGFAGFHQVYPSPSGRYVVGLSRAKDNLASDDGAPKSGIQVFQVDTPSAEVTFPPQPALGPTPERTSVRYTVPGQGEFVSGAWSRDGRYFYASFNGDILCAPFLESNGRLDIDTASFVAFPAGTTGFNNALQLLASFDGNFIFALDNANGAIVTYSRDLDDGSLTQVGTLATVSDPRGFTLDRTGTYLYVAGRESQQLAGYRVGSDGSLALLDLFPSSGLGAVPATLGNPLGDVAANPRLDQLYLGAYSGIVSGYTIDVATGALAANGGPATPLGGHRNLANIEVEPTGQFVIAAYEHDFDTFQDFVTPANGFPIDESNVFANTNSATNGTIPTVAFPELDASGRVAYVFPTTLASAFTGSVQAFRILDAAGNVRVEDAVESSNPYGLGFFQLVVQAPVPADETVVP